MRSSVQGPAPPAGPRMDPPEIGADLIHLIEHEDRIIAPALFDPLDDPARQGTDIGPPVPPDLRLISHPTEGDPGELPPHGPGNGHSQRGLPDPRRPHKAEDRALHVFLQLANGQILQDPLFHLL